MTSHTRLPILLALDSDWSSEKVWLDRLEGRIEGFKIGPILFCKEGPKLIEKVLSKGFDVFLDLKLHDIPNTVEKSVKICFDLGVRWLSLHCAGGLDMLRAAAQHQAEGKDLLGISMLTSLDEKDIQRIGFSGSIQDQVGRLGSLATEAGLRGLVCSVHELEFLRKHQPELYYVTPGIRQEVAGDDQKRSASFSEAMSSGARFAVIGRSLTAAPNWEKVWESLESSMAVKS